MRKENFEGKRKLRLKPAEELDDFDWKDELHNIKKQKEDEAEQEYIETGYKYDNEE